MDKLSELYGWRMTLSIPFGAMLKFGTYSWLSLAAFTGCSLISGSQAAWIGVIIGPQQHCLMNRLADRALWVIERIEEEKVLGTLEQNLQKYFVEAVP